MNIESTIKQIFLFVLYTLCERRNIVRNSMANKPERLICASATRSVHLNLI